MRAAACLLVALGLTLASTVGDAAAAPRKAATGRLEKTEDTVAGGTHWRIKVGGGAIHVWIPPGYDRRTAGTVVYVHGYHDTVDTAWTNHRLAQQFKASRQNAMFVVPEAPSGNGQAVHWPALTDLRRAVHRGNIRLPDGPIVVMGHSGAFRTMSKWVDHKLVTQVILLDALYGAEKAFDDFIFSGKRAKQHKLLMIGSDTAAESSAFIKRYPFAVALDRMPADVSGFDKRARRARLLYVRSQYGHMQMVTGGAVIPVLLRLTPLKRL
ncbi:MAG: hypothetical protein R2939_04860 [Kofleriaceae bacterium]